MGDVLAAVVDYLAASRAHDAAWWAAQTELRELDSGRGLPEGVNLDGMSSGAFAVQGRGYCRQSPEAELIEILGDDVPDHNLLTVLHGEHPEVIVNPEVLAESCT